MLWNQHNLWFTRMTFEMYVRSSVCQPGSEAIKQPAETMGVPLMIFLGMHP